jgi:hypothetical protein
MAGAMVALLVLATVAAAALCLDSYNQLTNYMNKQICNTLIVKGHHFYFNFTIFGPHFMHVFSASPYNNSISKRAQEL